MSILQKHPKITTRDRHGEPNGYLIPIFNATEGAVAPTQHPQQVYLTVVAPRSVKGPHLHMKRWGLFTCVKGNVRIVARTDQGYEHFHTGEDYEFATVQIPAGVPSALQNMGDAEAWVLNMPSPAWKLDDQDDHPVSFDDYDFGDR